MKTMKLTKCALIVLLSCMAAAVWAQKKIGMMLPETPTVSATDRSLTIPDGLSYDEKAAAQWFYDEYISPARYATAEVRGKFVDTDLSDLDVVWVMIDRTNIAKENVESTLGTGKTEALKTFYQTNGGNVLLTNAATQLLVATERLSSNYGPNEWNTNNSTSNNDTWGQNPWIGLQSNFIGHDIYCGLARQDNNGHWMYALNNAQTKKDHTTMWKFKEYNSDISGLFGDDDKGVNNLSKFENKNNCSVIGTYEWDTNYAMAGIIEFYRQGNYGLSIAIGPGAYEWAAAGNGFRSNIEKMTRNALRYLKSKAKKVGEVKIGYFLLTHREGTDIVPGVLKTESYYGENENEGDYVDLDEKEAYAWFYNNYVNPATPRTDGKKGYSLTLDYLSQNDINDFDVIWVHIDREIKQFDDDGNEIETFKYYNTYKNDETAVDMSTVFGLGSNDEDVRKSYTALMNYYKNGGNLLLTSEAGLLLSKDAFGRLSGNPRAVYHEPDNIEDCTVWGINAHCYEGENSASIERDQRNHPIYKGLTTRFVSLELQDGDYADGYDIYPLILGRGGRDNAKSTGITANSDNHNFVFGGAYYEEGQPLYTGADNLENRENCTVLGFWGQNRKKEGAGLVELHPTRLFAGRAVTIGFGAYDWYALDDNGEEFNKGENGYRGNIEKLTENAIDYLVGSDKIEVEFNKVGQGYSTMYYSYYDLVVPDNTIACIYTTVNDNKNYNEEHGWNEQHTEYVEIGSGEVIPARTAVVLYTIPDAYKAEANAEKIVRTFSTISNYSSPNSTGMTRTEDNPNDIEAEEKTNLLHGSDLGERVTGEDGDNSKYYFVSVKKDAQNADIVAFYWYTADGYVSTDSPLVCPAHKAYLKLSEQQAALARYIRLPFIDGNEEEEEQNATAIGAEMTTPGLATDACYTLQGVKVSGDNLKRGIYIVNGKKVIIK